MVLSPFECGYRNKVPEDPHFRPRLCGSRTRLGPPSDPRNERSIGQRVFEVKGFCLDKSYPLSPPLWIIQGSRSKGSQVGMGFYLFRGRSDGEVVEIRRRGSFLTRTMSRWYFKKYQDDGRSDRRWRER